jgi:ferredoxin
MKVRFLPTGVEVEVEAGTTLFEASQMAQLPVGSSCGADGTCGKCGLRLLSGTLPEPTDRERKVAMDNRSSDGLRLSCMVTVESDVVVTADYW